jgi:putative chitinase
MHIAKADLERFAPHALPAHIDALAAGGPALAMAGIDRPLRWCHFLAQVTTESGRLRKMREDTRWTGARMKAMWPSRFPLGAADPRIIAARGDPQALANLAYGKVKGNEGGDDGWRYRGGGLIQLTGRSNYRDCGMAIGIDLENDPDLIEQPDVSLSAAIWFWSLEPNNQFADSNYSRAISNAINRGNPYSSRDPVGWDHRQQWFARAWAVWGPGEQLPPADVLRLGAHGPKVRLVQVRLRDLGYPVGAVDDAFGPAMARAVAGFKLDAARGGATLEAAEIVGPATMAALEAAEPAPLSPERTEATARDLEAAGSTEVAAGRRAKAAGQAAFYTGGTLAADMLGALDILKGAMSGITGLHATAVPALSAVQWGLRNLLPLVLIVGGVWAWRAFGDVIVARLTAHQNGSNLGR